MFSNFAKVLRQQINLQMARSNYKFSAETYRLWLTMMEYGRAV